MSRRIDARHSRLAAVLSTGAALAMVAALHPAGAVPSGGANGSADCAAPGKPGRFEDGKDRATVTVTEVGADCRRTYRLVSSVTGERVFTEQRGKPTMRSGSVLLDGLYAMSHVEAGQNKADQLTDEAYNGGKPTDCPGGCYTTGKEWTYVWTRDVAYSADLGLTAADAERMRNTLRFKLSDRRDGSGDTQIIQDTGTGGSYPNSTDRVVWALGAGEIIDWLPDGERQAFAAEAYEAIRNTVEHDRKVVFDREDGLYLGEQSFLDWREQSYPEWTKKNVAPIATSRSLSTNVTHWAAVDAASRLAAGAGDKAAATKYRSWADDLTAAIREAFWLPEKNQFSQMLSTELDASPVNRYDALGTSLAVLTGVATPEQAEKAVANYPQTPHGPPVLWPQQQGVEPYHNNGIWPFVTAYMMRAAARTGNDGAATAQARSLVRGAALFGTNKENINLLNGGTDTELNSDRQLWSIAGMMSMVQQSVFGLDAKEDGLHVAPFLPAQLREKYFAGSDHAVLHGIDYRGHKLDVRLNLPRGEARNGAYTVKSMTLDGKRMRPGGAITESVLGGDTSELVVELGRPAGKGTPAPEPADTGSKEALYGPTTPEVRKVGLRDGRPELTVGLGDEKPSRVTMDVLRDGEVIAENVDPSKTGQTWTDDRSAEPDTVSHCYSVRLTYRSSGNTSQHAEPKCYWGPDGERVHRITGEDFEATGGERSSSENGVFYDGWGSGPGDRLSAEITPEAGGEYLLQADAALAGPVNTGVTAGMKKLRVRDTGTGEVVAEDVITMAHTGSPKSVQGSTYARARLEEGTRYRIELVQDPLAVNMSYFSSNALYRDTRDGPGNESDVYAIKAMLKEADTE